MIDPSLLLGLFTLLGTIASVTGAIFVATHQKPSKDFIDIIGELRQSKKDLQEDNARLRTEADSANTKAQRSENARAYLESEVAKDYPSAVNISREIANGTTERHV